MQLRFSIPFVGGITCVMEQDEVNQKKADLKNKLASWKQRTKTLVGNAAEAAQQQLKAAKAGVAAGVEAYKQSNKPVDKGK